MTNAQLYLAIGVPMAFNALLFSLLIFYVNAKFAFVNQRIDALSQRLDDMRDLWRAELLRVEGVIDARLKHLEDAR